MVESMIKLAIFLFLIPLARAANSSFCTTQNVCGSYGFCDSTKLECFCPETFSAVISTDASKGCKPGSYTSQYINLTQVAYSSYLDYDAYYSSTTSSDCLDKCSQNIRKSRYRLRCYAAFYNASGNCRLVLEELGSIIYTADANDLAFIYVNGKPKSSKISIGAIVGGVAGGIVVLIGAIVIVICCIKKHDKTKVPTQPGPKISGDVEVGVLGPQKFTYSEIEVMTKKFKEKIGDGGFAEVFKGWTKTGTVLAVKVIKASSTAKDFQREVSVLSVTHHWNLVDFLGYCTDNGKMILVYKFMVNGSLDRWIFQNSDPKTVLSWETRFNIITGVASGMYYLHEQCGNIVLHLDLKPQNILLDEKFIPKVADFGLSKLMDRDQSMTMTMTIRGTPLYIAPETLMGAGLNDKMDVYSFGVILLETVAGRSILELPGATLAEAVTSFGRQDYFPFELVDAAIHRSVNRAEAKRVLQVAFLCLLPNPERPSMCSVLHMLQGRIPIQTMSTPQVTTLKEIFAAKRPGMSLNPAFGANYSQSISESASGNYQPQYSPSPLLGSGR